MLTNLEVEHYCAHCGKPNPKYCVESLYCCEECKKDLNYYIVHDDDFGQVIRKTRILTKKFAEKLLKKIIDSGSVLIDHNIRVVTKKEFEYLKLLRKKFYLDMDIKRTEKELEEKKGELMELQNLIKNFK